MDRPEVSHGFPGLKAALHKVMYRELRKEHRAQTPNIGAVVSGVGVPLRRYSMLLARLRQRHFPYRGKLLVIVCMPLSSNVAAAAEAVGMVYLNSGRNGSAEESNVWGTDFLEVETSIRYRMNSARCSHAELLIVPGIISISF